MNRRIFFYITHGMERYEFKLAPAYSLYYGAEIIEQNGSFIKFRTEDASVRTKARLRKAFSDYVEFVRCQNDCPDRFLRRTVILFGRGNIYGKRLPRRQTVHGDGAAGSGRTRFLAGRISVTEKNAAELGLSRAQGILLDGILSDGTGIVLFCGKKQSDIMPFMERLCRGNDKVTVWNRIVENGDDVREILVQAVTGKLVAAATMASCAAEGAAALTSAGTASKIMRAVLRCVITAERDSFCPGKGISGAKFIADVAVPNRRYSGISAENIEMTERQFSHRTNFREAAARALAEKHVS